MNKDYKIYKSKTVLENHSEIVSECVKLNKEIRENYSVGDGYSTTWEYGRYNVFNLRRGNKLFDALREELVDIIKENCVGECWVQSWMNFDTYESVEETLKNHGHALPFHGYISIDPKNTKTIFDNAGFEIENKIGNIYFGPGNDLTTDKWLHKVINTSKYDGNRITIAYDIRFDHPRIEPHRWFKID